MHLKQRASGASVPPGQTRSPSLSGLAGKQAFWEHPSSPVLGTSSRCTFPAALRDGRSYPPCAEEGTETHKAKGTQSSYAQDS